MDTAFLGSFVAVVDAGSMAEAARRLDFTPAAIAQQVRTLERELGVALIARRGRTVRPTDAGHRLVERARVLLRQIDELKSLARDEHDAGELRLGAINTALHSTLPETLAKFAKAHPKVRVFIESGLSLHLCEAVRRGELDAAVCLRPPFARSKAFDWELLREEPLVVLAPQRLARRDPHALLRSEPLIRYDRHLGGGRQADRYLRKAGIVAHERFELSSLLAIAMMVDRGLGVSLVPDIASPLSAGLRVSRLALPGPVESRRLGVLWQRASARADLVQRLVRCAAEVARG